MQVDYQTSGTNTGTVDHLFSCDERMNRKRPKCMNEVLDIFG